jgi:hypothetical protein
VFLEQLTQSQLMEHWLQSLISGLQLMLARQY